MKGRKVLVEFNPNFIKKLEVDDLIDKLPLDLKRVVVLCCIEDLPVTKVAKILNVHRTTVYRKLNKALKILENNG